MKLFVPAILVLTAVSTTFAEQQGHNQLVKREPDVAGFFSSVGQAVGDFFGHAATDDETTAASPATSKSSSKAPATTAPPTTAASPTTDDGNVTDTKDTKTSKTKDNDTDKTKATSTPKTTAATTDTDEEPTENNTDNEDEEDTTPSPTGATCSKDGEIQCVGTGSSSYQKCDGSNWIAQTCGSGNVCGKDDAGKTACITKAAANREKCSVKDQQRCVGSGSTKYQECNGNVWVDSKCDSGFCIPDGNKVKCGTNSTDATSVPYQMVSMTGYVPTNTASGTAASMAFAAAAAFAIALVAGI
ncbi:hypothetical protein DL89DRAFT_289588 [Linderina pennispora]|uniref:Carbohydrate-binding module family 19 domain-containing protein n=1 Tax=Linderina pennispora TaxID=61395 RepID=A0A1Y1WJY8_9FUNG|nr:uncharacterized protein DL89DRAFT_289588 [Linderina pennispora]ORX73900.1 hypothetical protein DL89DRAFT_289588 [Linderina pennispora]